MAAPAGAASAGVDGHIKCPCSVTAVLESVLFDTTVKVCRAKTTISAPHWENGVNVDDGAGSQRAAVYLVSGKGTDKLTVKLNITSVVNCSGTAKLTGTIGDLIIEGDCPVSVDKHDVNCHVKNMPFAIKQYQGDISWKLEVPKCNTYTLTPTRAELYVVLDTPISPYQAFYGVWVEVLRFLCSKVGVVGKSTKKDVVAAVARYCHGSHSLTYDTKHGAAHYGVLGGGGTFDLGRYLVAASSACNCYDQAGAVQSLSGAVGASVKWLYLDPFGFLKTCNLVGVGQCNNPFFANNGTATVVDPNDPNRTAFGNHAFCEYLTGCVDACAGPHCATESRQEYIDASIEKETDITLYRHKRMEAANYKATHPVMTPDEANWVAANINRRPGTPADLQVTGGVNSVQ